MKFKYKILICMILIFLFSLDFYMYILIQKNMEILVKQELQRSEKELNFVVDSIYNNMLMAEYQGGEIDEKTSFLIMDSFVKQYLPLDIELSLYMNNEKIYPVKEKIKNPFIEQEMFYQDKKIWGSKNISTSFCQFVVVYEKDISYVFKSKDELVLYFEKVSVLLGILLTGVLYVVISCITQPIKQLSVSTRKFASGEYDCRNVLKTKDELGELSQNFNLMAEAIEEKIKQLEISVIEKQILVDNLSHEIRTPLTSIQGFSEFLLQASYSEEDKYTALSYIHSESKRLKEIALKILDMSYWKHNSIKKETIHILQLFEQVAFTEKIVCEQKGIQINIHSDVDTILCDAHLVYSLLLNLIDNAIHACGFNDRIELTAYIEDGSTVLEVHDTGCGMSEEDVSRIFEPFFRVDKARSRENGGAGLGLNLCKNIMDIHGGSIQVFTKKQEGTKIKLYFTSI